MALLSGGGVGVGDSLDNMDDALVSRETVVEVEVESLVPGLVHLPERRPAAVAGGGAHCLAPAGGLEAGHRG